MTSSKPTNLNNALNSRTVPTDIVAWLHAEVTRYDARVGHALLTALRRLLNTPLFTDPSTGEKVFDITGRRRRFILALLSALGDGTVVSKPDDTDCIGRVELRLPGYDLPLTVVVSTTTTTHQLPTESMQQHVKLTSQELRAATQPKKAEDEVAEAYADLQADEFEKADEVGAPKYEAFPMDLWDAIRESASKQTVEPGDKWRFGEHKLVFFDCGEGTPLEHGVLSGITFRVVWVTAPGHANMKGLGGATLRSSRRLVGLIGLRADRPDLPLPDLLRAKVIRVYYTELMLYGGSVEEIAEGPSQADNITVGLAFEVMEPCEIRDYSATNRYIVALHEYLPIWYVMKLGKGGKYAWIRSGAKAPDPSKEFDAMNKNSCFRVKQKDLLELFKKPYVRVLDSKVTRLDPIRLTLWDLVVGTKFRAVHTSDIAWSDEEDGDHGRYDLFDENSEDGCMWIVAMLDPADRRFLWIGPLADAAHEPMDFAELAKHVRTYCYRVKRKALLKLFKAKCLVLES